MVRSLVTALAVSLMANAQEEIKRPNFSGRWTQESQPKPFNGQGGFCPGECLIEHTTDRLLAKSSLGTRTIDLRNPTVTIDNSNQKVRVERSIVASWEGASLVVTSTFKELTPSAAATTSTVRLALRDGRLVISGSALNPLKGAFDFEIIYRRSSFENRGD